MTLVIEKKILRVYAELTLLSEKIPWAGIDGFEGLEPLIEVAAQRCLRLKRIFRVGHSPRCQKERKGPPRDAAPPPQPRLVVMSEGLATTLGIETNAEWL